MSASRPSTRMFLAAFALVVVFAVAPSALAAKGSISTTATTVTSGDTFTVNVCVATARDGGYLLVKGPNTFSQDFFFGPVSGCADVYVPTPGWPAGKYRITGYELTRKGTTRLGTITLTVTA